MATQEQLAMLQATMQSTKGSASINVRGRAAGPGGRRSSVAKIPMPNMAQLGNSRSPSPVSISGSVTGSVRSTSTWKSQSQLEEEALEEAARERANKPYRHPEGTYEGESNTNMQPHGVGTYFYKNGDVYSGSWQNGIRHGTGTITYTTGETYTGNYQESLASGLGEYKFLNGDKYTGTCVCV